MGTLPNRIPEAENAFPFLAAEGYKCTSPQDARYNCIAWAAGISNQWWWPDDFGVYFWPNQIPRLATLDAYIKAFNLLGYVECINGDFESGFEKVAIYANTQNEPLHAARQISAGKWTSKLGREHDIEHTLRGLESAVYGTPKIFMKRRMGVT